MPEQDSFKFYYENSFGPYSIIIPNIKFRHYRFQKFGSNKFVRMKDIISTKEQLYEKILHTIPLNAYFTPTRWLNPIFVGKTKEETDVLLYAPLYFDIDSEDLKPSTFQQAKIMTRRLIDYIKSKYGKAPDLVVFSGRRGFHVYYWDWDTFKLQNMIPSKRIQYFIAERTRMLRELSQDGIITDNRVTNDPYRIMRIPNTLHGKTGLIATKVVNIEEFDPVRQALAFKYEEYVEKLGVNLNMLF